MPVKLHQLPAHERFAEMAKRGAAIKNLGKMCNDCACRLQSLENNPGYAEAVANVESSLLWDGQFNCHEDGKDAGRPCVGVLYIKQYFGIIE